MIDTSKRAAARQRRLAVFPGEGTPPIGQACQLLCEDHVGTYTLPYLCRWSDGTWRNASTAEPVKSGVVGLESSVLQELTISLNPKLQLGTATPAAAVLRKLSHKGDLAALSSDL